MQVTQLHHPHEPNRIPNEEVVMALSFFGGIHKGHQRVIETGKKITKEKGLKSTVMAFDQYPSIVFQKVLPGNMEYLASLEQKERLMTNSGVDILYIVEFTSASTRSKPQDFVNQYVVNLDSTVAVSGSDCVYDLKGITGVKQLPIYAQGRLEMVAVPKEKIADAKTDSTRIHREMGASGMEEVTELLRYVYETERTVVHGDVRGRLLGFPTANTKVRDAVRLPRIGAYIIQTEIGDKWYVGMGSIGRNDTFGEGRGLIVEIYILGSHQDIYGEQVVVRWDHYLRSRMKSNGAEALIDQLRQDERGMADYFQQPEDK